MNGKAQKSHGGRDLDCMADVLMGFHRSTFSKPNTEFNSGLSYLVLVVKPEEKRLLGRPWHKLDNIEIDFTRNDV
jgi:hypothetical protein